MLLERRRGSLALVLFCVALLLGACSDSRANESTPTAPGALSAASEALTTIDEAREISASDRKLLYDAQFENVRRCMQAKGFTYKVPTYYDDSSPTPLQFEVGPADLEVAKAYGYRTFTEMYPPPDGSGNQDIGVPADPSQATAFLAALDGTAPTVLNSAGPTLLEGGCFPQSWDAVYQGHAEEREALRMQLSVYADDMYSKYIADPQVLALNKAWSDCVATSGYSDASPREAREHWLSIGGDQPSSDELAAAIADVACKESTNYLQVARGVILSLQSEVDPQIESQLAEYLVYKNDAIQWATDFLAS